MKLTKRLSSLIDNNKLLLIVGICWLFNAMNVSLFSFLLAALKQDWSLSSNQINSIINSNALGMVIGACFFGFYADNHGRKKTLIFTLLLFSIANGLCAFTSDFIIFLILRFVMGVGLGGQLPVALTLICEKAPLAERGRLIVLIEFFWSLGAFFSMIISHFLLPISAIGWRGVMLLMAFPALYAFYLAYKLDESPRYQTEKLSKQSKTWHYKLGCLVTPKYRKNILMLWIIWFCIVFSYYGLFLWLPSIMTIKGLGFVQSFKYILFITIVQIPSYFLVIWLIKYISSKLVLTLYLIGTLISAELFGNAVLKWELITYGGMLSFFNLGGWGVLYVYTSAQYPTSIRATGIGTTASIGLIGSILGPLIVKWLMAMNVPIPGIFSLFSIAILVAILTLIMREEYPPQK